MIKGDKFTLSTYEYKTVDHIPNGEELEGLGRNGWELCSILNLDMPNKIVYYFKRKCGELMAITDCCQ